MFSALVFMLIQPVGTAETYERLHRDTEALVKAVALANSPQGKFCESYVGQSPVITSFDTAVASAPKTILKDEFETTEQFDARRRLLESSSSRKPLVISVPVDRDYIEYDADTQELEIGSLAFGEPGLSDSTGTALAAVLVLMDAGLKAGLISVAIKVASTEKVTGSYLTQNGFGASVRITKIDKTTKAIFDRETDLTGIGYVDREAELMFPVARMSGHLVGSLHLNAVQARALKSTIRLGFLVDPKEPWFVSGSSSLIKATFQRPREVTDKLKILIADIQCGFAMDAAGKVLAAAPTD